VNAQLTLALLPDLIVAAGALLLLLWSSGRRDDDVDASRTAALIAVGVCAAALAAVGALAVRGAEDLVRPGSPIAATSSGGRRRGDPRRHGAVRAARG
jgi:hypothetical protein